MSTIDEKPVYKVFGNCRREAFGDGAECRKCSRFFCNVVGEQRCCADCLRKLKGTCIDPCLNDPDRCSLELKSVPESGTDED